MPSTASRTTMFGLPLDHDLLDGDLDSHFPDFAEGRKLMWGMAVSAIPGSWNEEVNLFGIDWQARLCPPGSFHIPHTSRRSAPRMYWRKVNRHCALIGVATEMTTVNEARDIGRLAVRRLAALLRREMSTLQLGDVLWEGALVRTSTGTLRFLAAGLEVEAASPKSPTDLHKLGLKLAPIAVTRLPEHLGRALEWLALARSARVKIEKFTHLWLALISLVDFGLDRDKTVQRDRIKRHLISTGGFLSRTARSELEVRLNKAYDVRNDLWHAGKDRAITPDFLRVLESDVFVLVDYEFAKLKTPISE